jgi:hypothetical protein
MKALSFYQQIRAPQDLAAGIETSDFNQLE